MIVDSISEARAVACEVLGDCSLDVASSKRAGYEIWRSVRERAYFCDLGDRVEVNLSNGRSFNVWVSHKSAEKIKQLSDTVSRQEATILKLKARLFDLLCN